MNVYRIIVMLGWVLGLGAAGGALALPARAEENHAGHDHAAEAHTSQEQGEAQEDPHAGHDHGPVDAEEADPHAGHDHGEEEEGLRLTPEQHERFGIVIETTQPGTLDQQVLLAGEVAFNEDRVVHLVPQVAGVVREVRKTVGDPVEAGECIVVLESRELATAKSEFLASLARTALAETVFTREQTLRDQAVSSEQDYLEAQQALAESRIVLRSAEQQLHALGFDEAALDILKQEPHMSITRYEVRAPIAGTVTARHAALGESLEATTDLFTIADLSSVWVNLTVYAKDLAAVRTGQAVTINAVDGRLTATGVIDRVTPFVDPATRSALARVMLANPESQWVPGTFVRAVVNLSATDAGVVVAREAVQTLDGREVVFTEHDGAFEPVPVTVGRTTRERVEILSGLAPGARYVARGAFNLKATVVTSSMDAHAGHGH